jgi:glycosyltransferase involved in cell wall biosynthesis
VALARALLRNARADQVVEGRPLVSVVLATYNWSSVLRYSIRSVLWQTYPNLELLVIGDGCTDDSEQVVASFGDRRVRWHNLESNSGSQAIPNNKGLELATGKYVAYLGHDDVWHPKHLATMVAHLQRESADFAYGLAEVLGPPGSRIRALSGLAQVPLPLGTWLPPTSLVHEAALARRIGGWRTWEEGGMAPDINFLGRVQGEGARMIQVPAMTAFKFPAALRSNVYRERPSHEQRAYVTRMERERLFIERELAALALARLSPRRNRSRRETFASLVGMEPEEQQAYLRRVRGLD